MHYWHYYGIANGEDGGQSFRACQCGTTECLSYAGRGPHWKEVLAEFECDECHEYEVRFPKKESPRE